MSALVRVGWRRGQPGDALVSREWLVPNGLGGYASGTLGGMSTRRFHGLLVASLGGSRGRTMILNRLDAELVFADGSRSLLDGFEQLDGKRWLPESLVEVRFEDGLPIWHFESHGARVEKQLSCPMVETRRSSSGRSSTQRRLSRCSSDLRCTCGDTTAASGATRRPTRSAHASMAATSTLAPACRRSGCVSPELRSA